MAVYAFVTRWRIAAPIERVFETISDVERWPTWWPGVRSVQVVQRGADDGVGWVHRYVFRSRLPYSLVFDVRVTEVERPTRLAGVASGELAGTGVWTLRADGGATYLRYDWNVRTTRPWMNLLGRVARPLFARNHDIVMDGGRRGLARRLGVRVVREEAV